MVASRDLALRTVGQIVNRQVPIRGGVTVIVFRPGLTLDGVASALGRWAEEHSYGWTEQRAARENLFGLEFQTIGFAVLANKGELAPDAQVERIDVSASVCAGQQFADKVVDLFGGESMEHVADATVVMVIRNGRSAVQAARALLELVTKQVGCGREGMRRRELHSAPLRQSSGTVCEIHLITREC